MSESLILVPSFRLFSFCWFVLSSLDVMGFGLSFILFCHVLLLSLRNLFFLSRGTEGVDPDGRGDREELGGVETVQGKL